jgi:hypothetical protein
MPEYDNTNTGAIFRNDKKSADQHPDYTGSLDVDGVPHYIDCWLRNKKDGSGKFFSVRIKPKGQAAPQRKVTPNTSAADPLDDIPFAPHHRGALSALA